MKLTLKLPLPPSINNYLFPVIRYVGKRPIARNIKTPEVRTWEQINIPVIKRAIKDQNWIQPEEGKFVNILIHFFFPRKGFDAGNYNKVLLDAFTEAGIYIDDQYAKPQTGYIAIDKFNPRIEVEISVDDQIGVFKSNDSRDRFIFLYGNELPKRSFDALMKKLDQGRITEKVYLDSEFNLHLLNEFKKETKK